MRRADGSSRGSKLDKSENADRLRLTVQSCGTVQFRGLGRCPPTAPDEMQQSELENSMFLRLHATMKPFCRERPPNEAKEQNVNFKRLAALADQAESSPS